MKPIYPTNFLMLLGIYSYSKGRGTSFTFLCQTSWKYCDGMFTWRHFINGASELDGTQSVAEAHVGGGLQDAQSGSARVRGGFGRAVLQLQVEVQ